jgi:hypothetical protein
MSGMISGRSVPVPECLILAADLFEEKSPNKVINFECMCYSVTGKVSILTLDRDITHSRIKSYYFPISGD